MEKAMNIKRAFLAAAAVLMVPGYAMAQTADFDTQIDTTNGVEVTAHAWIQCNTGNNLEQDQAISNQPDPGTGGVDFVVTDLVLDADAVCNVWFTDIPAGFEFYSLNTNGVGTNDGAPNCEFAYDQEDLLESNYCYLEVAPAPFEYTMNKVWDVPANSVGEFFRMNYTCYNVASNSFQTNTTTSVSSSWSDTGDSSYTVDNLYIDPQGGDTYCRAWETTYDSAVESDQGCQNAVHFDNNGTTGECTVTNTVFFEGIPTLSQYGLAILAVLMLGVGFVGFRRFV
jgi:hypothetical protein